ncbi:SDR family oxidoreductase, partial [Candidatus Bathyarchaeota archaeon]|nr:SDR family oxidoreductase [Candidatus Bathyarchaeota archaeon]
MIARALATNGAKVYITGRTLSKLEAVVESFGKDIPGELIPVTCDVSQKESISQLQDYIAEREKSICILVNNAGVSTGRIPVEGKHTADELKAQMFDNDEANFDSWMTDYRTNTASVY